MTIHKRVISGLALAAIASPAAAHDLGFAHGHSEIALLAAIVAVTGVSALALFRRSQSQSSAKVRAIRKDDR